MGYPFQYKSIKVVPAQKKCDHLYQNNQNQIQFPPYSPGKLEKKFHEGKHIIALACRLITIL